MINILIADDHKVFRDGIESIVEHHEDMDIIAHAVDGREVLEKLKTTQPDLILMDISMGGANGIETTMIVKKEYPQIKILVVSMHHESNYIVRMLEAGADGYLVKNAGSTELVNAIRIVSGGNTYYSKDVSAAIVEHLTKANAPERQEKEIPLTKREIEVLKLITEEYTNAEIAEKLFISIRTVDAHRRNLLEKLGAKNTAGLVKFALKHGISE